MTSHTVMAGNGRNAKIGGVAGVIAGIFLLAQFAVSILLPPFPTPAEQLANFESRRTLFTASIVLGVLFGLFAVAYLISLRNALKGKDNTLATAAATLFIVGLAVVGVTIVTVTSYHAALATIYTSPTSTAQDRATAVLLWSTHPASGAFSLGIAAAAAGLFLYGYVMLNSKTFPNWVGYLGIVGGILNFVSLIPVEAGALALLLGLASFIPLLIWIFAAAALLWQSTGKTTSA